MLRVENLCKKFGNIHAVEDVTFSLPEGKITIIAGADGAGKSTLFKIMIGLVRKDSGEIFYDDAPVGDRFQRLTSVTGYMPERFSLYPDLTVEENLNFFADINQVPRPRREELKNRMLEKTGMLPFRKRRARALSGGMKQKLSLSSILLSAPRIIFLDEPTTGVDPLSRIEFFDIIDELKQEGKTIFMATPYLDEAEKGENIILFKNGRIIKTDSLDNLKEEFPLKILQIVPLENIYETVTALNRDPELRGKFYIRGEYIKAWQTPGQDLLSLIPHSRWQEVEPRLEDIYLYHERRLTDKQSGEAT